MPKLRFMPDLVKTVDTRTALPRPYQHPPRQRKKADPFYASPQYRAWRAKVVAKAGGRCEHVSYGQRCTKTQPQHRMFADHVRELRDGGQPFDPNNGQLLCGPHHLMKTAQTRRDRKTRGGIGVLKGPEE